MLTFYSSLVNVLKRFTALWTEQNRLPWFFLLFMHDFPLTFEKWLLKKKKKYLYGCMTKLIIFKKCRVTHFLINGGTRLTVLHVVLWKRISWHNEVWCLSYEFKKWCAIWTSEGGLLEWVTWVVCLRGWHAKLDDVGDVCGLCLCVYECFISIWCNIVLIGI